MSDFKNWWKSKTIWGSLASLVSGVLVSTGAVGADQGADIALSVPEIAAGVATVVGSVVALFGRLTATKKIV